jgi:peptide/nickel transport system substrate-binding protein
MPKIMVELEANPEYFRGKPKIDRVVLKFINNVIPELMSGSIDAVEYFDRSDVPKLKGDNRFRSYYDWANQVTSIYWNHNHPLFRNKEIRRALTMAINRAELSSLLNYPDDVPILDTITTWRQFRQGAYSDPLPNDPDQARKILEKHGWHDTNGDGIREREGKEFRFSAAISSLLQGSKESAIYVQDQFRRIGVRMDIQILEDDLIWQRIQTGDFEALFFYIVGLLNHPRYGDAKLFGKESPLGYKNPEIIRLLDMALLEMDPDKLDSIYKKIMPIFIEDMPMTFLLPRIYSSIAHRRIKGLKSLKRIFPVWNLEYLWIEEEK